MSEELKPLYPPLLASDVTEDWINRCRYASMLPDVELRVNGNTIESRYRHSMVGWQPIMLCNSGTQFVNEEEATKIYERIKP